MKCVEQFRAQLFSLCHEALLAKSVACQTSIPQERVQISGSGQGKKHNAYGFKYALIMALYTHEKHDRSLCLYTVTGYGDHRIQKCHWDLAQPRCDLSCLMPGLHLQLNRRKSQAPPATQPSLIFKDLRRLSCRWSPTLKSGSTSNATVVNL